MGQGEDDPFLKCAKAFGGDAAAVRDWAAGVLGESANVLEQQPDGSFCMREVGLRELAILDSRKY